MAAVTIPHKIAAAQLPDETNCFGVVVGVMGAVVVVVVLALASPGSQVPERVALMINRCVALNRGLHVDRVKVAVVVGLSTATSVGATSVWDVTL